MASKEINVPKDGEFETKGYTHLVHRLLMYKVFCCPGCAPAAALPLDVCVEQREMITLRNLHTVRNGEEATTS